jgi:hypothetical protein
MDFEYTRRGNFPTRPNWPALEQILTAIFFQPLHDFSDVLGALAGADQEGIGRFDYD